MAVPKYNEFFPAFLTCLGDGKVHSLQEIREYCMDALELSDADRNEQLPSGRNLVRDRVGCARTHLKKAGLIDSPAKAHFAITELGRQVLNKGTDILTLEYIHNLQIQNGEFSVDTAAPLNAGIADNEQSPQEKIEYAIEELNSDLSDELLAELGKMDCYAFEQLVVNLLIKMGYGSLMLNRDAVTKKSGDEGIDGVVTADRFGFDTVYTQAKKWKGDSNVGRPDIQRFLGALAGQGATKGLFITTGQFTKEAREYAQKQLNHKIVLVDGQELTKLMIEYNLGVTTVSTYEIKRIDSDFFDNET